MAKCRRSVTLRSYPSTQTSAPQVVPQENGAENGESKVMSYLNAVTLVGFVGADPEQRQARNGGAKFTVLSVATQRSWKNADDEWSSKNRVAPGHSVPATPGRPCRSHHQERRACARRRRTRQL